MFLRVQFQEHLETWTTQIRYLQSMMQFIILFWCFNNEMRGWSSVDRALASHSNDPGSISDPGIVQFWICVILNDVSTRLPRGTFNRGAVCIHMHLRTCVDIKEPGWPSEPLIRGPEKDRYLANMWLILTGGLALIRSNEPRPINMEEEEIL